MPHPKTYFGSTQEREHSGTAFVLMPFAAHFAPVYDAILDALESADIGFRCKRADELSGGHEVMEGVLREIARAEVIIADLTGRNPNVFYELGIAHMTKVADRVLLMVQNMDDVPFDLRPYRCIVYTADSNGLRALKRRLTEAVREVAGTCYRFALTGQNSRHDTEPLFQAPDRCLYSFHIAHAMLAPNFMKCYLTIDRHVVGREPSRVHEDTYGFNEGETIRPYDDLPWALRLESVDTSHAAFAIVPA